MSTLLSANGARVIAAWADSAVVGIDVTERSHARVRQDLKSDARARSFTRAVDTAVCQDLRAIHVAAGGSDPAKLETAPAADPDFGDLALVDFATEKPQKASREGRGLNPYLQFRNHKFSTFKQIHAPDRPMSLAERRALGKTCREEWNAMAADAQSDWRRVRKGSQLARELVSTDIVADKAPIQPFASWCGAGCAGCPLPLHGIREAWSTGGAPQTAAPDVQSAEARTASLPPAWRLLWQF